MDEQLFSFGGGGGGVVLHKIEKRVSSVRLELRQSLVTLQCKLPVAKLDKVRSEHTSTFVCAFFFTASFFTFCRLLCYSPMILIIINRLTHS